MFFNYFNAFSKENVVNDDAAAADNDFINKDAINKNILLAPMLIECNR